jgi:hypothetical protein
MDSVLFGQSSRQRKTPADGEPTRRRCTPRPAPVHALALKSPQPHQEGSVFINKKKGRATKARPTKNQRQEAAQNGL